MSLQCTSKNVSIDQWRFHSSHCRYTLVWTHIYPFDGKCCWFRVRAHDDDEDRNRVSDNDELMMKGVMVVMVIIVR